MWSVWLIFCDCVFHSVCPVMDENKRLWELPDGRDWLWGKLVLVLKGGAMLSKSLIQFNSDDHYIYNCGQECLRRNEVALIVNNRFRNTVLGCNLKNDTMILVHFQCKPFNITVIQVNAPTTDANETEADQFYEDLQDLLKLTFHPQKCPFHHRGLECKSRR